MTHAIDRSTLKIALAARLWYVPLVASSIFGILYVDSRFIVDGNTSATIARILAGELMYRLGTAAFLFGQVSQVPIVASIANYMAMGEPVFVLWFLIFGVRNPIRLKA